MGFIQTVYRKGPRINIADYQNFYEMGDSELAYTADTANNQALINDNSNQTTDPIQGKLALFTNSPTNQGLNNMGWPAGDVDKTITCIFKADSLIFKNLFADSAAFSNNYVGVTTSTIDVITPGGGHIFVAAGLTTADFFHLGVTVTSDFKFRMYINGIESSTGVKTGTGTLELTTIANADTTSTFADFLGRIGKVRIYNKVKTAAEMKAISNTDLKVA